MTDSSILVRIQTDLTAAMKSQDADTLSTLRMLKTALMEIKTKKSKDAALTGDEEIEVLQRYVKKRRETIDELRKVGREDLVAREQQEITVTSRYLPEEIGEDELRALVRLTVEKLQVTGPKEMGKVIGAVMAQAKGRADGATVSRIVREVLGTWSGTESDRRGQAGVLGRGRRAGFGRRRARLRSRAGAIRTATRTG